MLPWRMMAVALFYCIILRGDAQGQTKALFPGSSRIKRGVATVGNPTFHNSLEDAHLLFEAMLSGASFGPSGEFSVQDAELDSLRRIKNLKVICEEFVPKDLSDVFRLISDLSHHGGPMHQGDFERTMLTLVYVAQQVSASTSDHQRDMWAESFVSLYKAVKQDLTGTN